MKTIIVDSKYGETKFGSKRLRRNTFRLLILFGMYLCINGYFDYRSYKFYRGIIPAKITTTSYFDSYLSSNGANLGATLFGGACGTAVFTLSDDTLRQIQTQGLAFFSDANAGFGKQSSGGAVPVVYKEWHETPVNPEGLADGLSPAFGKNCSTEPSKGWYKKIFNAYQRPGSYITSNQHGGELFVVPSMKIVMFSYFN